ncbi:hypothetical protein Q5P01_015575 [Channa striata]|uniref:Uncharacterized protein n=1 Tax=Channa striata TaxID=64152 RepID=A0AA88SFD3_CHASR|nr:hypothetical protein Q5P01_015575 [Channa striata]
MRTKLTMVYVMSFTLERLCTSFEWRQDLARQLFGKNIAGAELQQSQDDFWRPGLISHHVAPCTCPRVFPHLSTIPPTPQTLNRTDGAFPGRGKPDTYLQSESFALQRLDDEDTKEERKCPLFAGQKTIVSSEWT